MSAHFIDGECEAIQEGDDSCSLSFEDLESPPLNPQDDSCLSLCSVNSAERSPHPQDVGARSVDSSSPHVRSWMMRHRPWTPETVAAELPILPRLFAPVVSMFESPDSDHIPRSHVRNMERSSTTAVHNDDSVRSHYSSASLPPLRGSDFFSLDAQDNTESGAATKPSSPNRRHTVDNVKVALVSTPKSPMDKRRSPRPSVAAMTQIDEELTTLPYVVTAGANSLVTTPKSGLPKRRRSITDPSGCVSMAASHENDPRERNSTRQATPAWTPKKQGLRKKHHSLDSFSAWQTPSSDKSNRPRASSAAMAHIDEHRALSDDESSEEGADGKMSLAIQKKTRRRCNTDPTACFSMTGDHDAKESPRKQPPASTATKQGLRKRHRSLGSFSAWQTRKLEQEDEGNSPLSRSSSLPSPPPERERREQQTSQGPGPRSRAESEPSREWFWIWA